MYNLNLNGFNIVMLISVFIGVTFALLLSFSKRQHQRANQFLGLMLLIIVMWIFWVVAIDMGLDNYFGLIDTLPFTYSLALGPSIYFYVNYLCFQDKPWRAFDAIHFTPVLLELMAHVAKLWESQSKGIPPTHTDVFNEIYPVLQLMSIISVGIYVYLCLKILLRFDLNLKNHFSDYFQYQFSWLRRLLILFAVLEMLWLPYTLIDYLMYDFQLTIEAYYPLYTLISIITIWIGIEAFLRPECVIIEKILRPEESTQTKSTDDDIRQGQWLLQEMERCRLYLEPDLNLKILADNLDIHPNNLSRIINKGLNKNFADFINEYRINEVIKRLNDPQHNEATLLDIALASGFNSKTTFNRIFKKFHSKTPAEFRRRLDQ